jgi:hypothetical protein
MAEFKTVTFTDNGDGTSTMVVTTNTLGELTSVFPSTLDEFFGQMFLAVEAEDGDAAYGVMKSMNDQAVSFPNGMDND